MGRDDDRPTTATDRTTTGTTATTTGTTGDDRRRHDRALSTTERDRAGAAAEQAVGGGSTATDVDADDDRGTAYDVEVRAADGTEWDVDLDRSFEVVSEAGRPLNRPPPAGPAHPAGRVGPVARDHRGMTLDVT